MVLTDADEIVELTRKRARKDKRATVSPPASVLLIK